MGNFPKFGYQLIEGPRSAILFWTEVCLDFRHWFRHLDHSLVCTTATLKKICTKPRNYSICIQGLSLRSSLFVLNTGSISTEALLLPKAIWGHPVLCNKKIGAYIHWIGLPYWNTGLDYWTGLLDWHILNTYCVVVGLIDFHWLGVLKKYLAYP